MNIRKIYENESYADELVLLAVKHAVVTRLLKKEDLSFLKKVALVEYNDFTSKLLEILPITNVNLPIPKNKTQSYLSRKRWEKVRARR